MKKLLVTDPTNTVALVARVLLGIVIFAHGAQKMFGWFGGYGFEGTMGFLTGAAGLPYIIALLVIIIEFFGALFLILGFATRLAAFGVIVNFAGVVMTSNLNFFMNWSKEAGKGEGLEYFILLFALAIISVITGGGRGSIDAAIVGRLKSNRITSIRKSVITTIGLIVSLSILQSCGKPSDSANSNENIDSMKKVALQLVASNDTIANRLKTFDELDFNVFSNQQWDRLKESHSENIKVYWPDGHVTEGIGVHIEDLKKLFIHAPDTRIKEHPIKFGSGNYTLVTGVFEGTFTEPMPIGNGKFIHPTGKAFKMPMATVGLWENGVMIEEHLFWDNQTYMNQIGLGNN